MFCFFTAAFFALLISSTPANAAERGRIGYGRLITNNFIGDGQDRWRTGSVDSSRVWGLRLWHLTTWRDLTATIAAMRRPCR